MIKSKFKSTGYLGLWGLFFISLCLLLLTILALLEVLGVYPTPLTIRLSYFIIIFYSPLFILSIITLKQNANIIYIDTAQKRITFSNRFLLSSSSFNLSEFDSFCTYAAQSRFGDFEIVYLIKNNKLIKQISGRVYENTAELKIGLGSIPFSGEKQFSNSDKLKILLQQAVNH